MKILDTTASVLEEIQKVYEPGETIGLAARSLAVMRHAM
jgi:hypothetical protein